MHACKLLFRYIHAQQLILISCASKMMKTVAREGFKETLPGVLSRVVGFILSPVIYTNLTVHVVNYIIQPASWKYIGLQIGFFICGMWTMLHNTQLNISCESIFKYPLIMGYNRFRCSATCRVVADQTSQYSDVFVLHTCIESRINQN